MLVSRTRGAQARGDLVKVTMWRWQKPWLLVVVRFARHQTSSAKRICRAHRCGALTIGGLALARGAHPALCRSSRRLERMGRSSSHGVLHP